MNKYVLGVILSPLYIVLVVMGYAIFYLVSIVTLITGIVSGATVRWWKGL